MPPKADLKKVDIAPPHYRDPAKMLRNIADSIDAGEYGDVATIVVALQGDTIETFGGGRDSYYPFCAYLFGVAHHRLLGVAS